MKIDVEHIARLAHLRLDNAQKEKFSRQMNDILAMVENLPNLRTIRPVWIPRTRCDCARMR